MRQRILMALLALVAAIGVQAQVLIKHNGEKVNFGNDKLVKITFDIYNENNGDNIYFVCESDSTFTFDIDEIHSLGFADDFSGLDEVVQSGKETILYDAANATVHIVNAKAEGVINIYDAAGKRVKSGKGCTIALGELAPGLYVVSFNNKLNAKILKK